LEKELALFPNLKVFVLMGDVAINALNNIAKRAGEERVIHSGSPSSRTKTGTLA
jgi:uracil-DNA glycosylase